VADDMLHFLTEVRVRILAFAPHTTQTFNILDLTLSDVLKRSLRDELPSADGKATATVKMQAYHDFGGIVIEPNVLTACCALALECDMRSESGDLLLTEEKLKGSAGFPGLGFIDFVLDSSPSR
jgi:hypothetical protein